VSGCRRAPQRGSAKGDRKAPRCGLPALRRLVGAAFSPKVVTGLTPRIAEVTREYQELRAQLTPGHPATGPLDDIRWMIEELRVNYFAQALGTPYPVSDKRVYKALDALV